LAAMPGIGVVVGKLMGLLGNRVGDLGAAVADVHAVEAGERVQAAAPVPVHDIDAFAAGDDPVRRVAPRMGRHMGRRVEEMVAIPGGEFVAAVEHAVAPDACAEGLGGGGQAASRQTYFSSVKASMPWREPSRPRPDCFTPPKGMGAPVILTRLTATMP